MKIATPVSIIILIFLFSCSRPANDLSKQKLHGKIKSVTSSNYSVVEKFGEVEKDTLDGKSVFIYNDKGYATECNVYNPDGSLYWNMKHKYDDENNNVEQDLYSANGSLLRKSVFKYNDDGDMIEESDIYSGSLTEKHVCRYDNNHHLTERKSYYKDGSLWQKIIYTYNDNDNVKQSIDSTYSSSNNSQRKYTYEYDDKDNLIEQQITEDDGSSAKQVYKYPEYDKKGNWTRQITFENDKPTVIIERTIEYY